MPVSRSTAAAPAALETRRRQPRDFQVNRRNFSAALIGAGFGAGTLPLAAPASAQGVAPVEGKQFVRVDPPVAASAAGKVEVIEFFSYACPHCSALEPFVAAWAAKLPPTVAFHRVPVLFLMNNENFARIYYALESMGQVDAMQRKVFAAVHVDRVPLDKPADIAAWMAKSGIDGPKFLDQFNSFSVASSVKRAKKLMADYKIDSVPSIAVQGRYLTSPSQAGGLQETLTVTDYLIQRTRVA